jgi:hypothetical protein
MFALALGVAPSLASCGEDDTGAGTTPSGPASTGPASTGSASGGTGAGASGANGGAAGAGAGGAAGGAGGAGSFAGVVCGAATCFQPQFCCTTDLGVTGTCGSFPRGCGPGMTPNHCDGPEECDASAECCLTQGSAACLPDGTCAQVGGDLFCHTASECGGAYCCPLTPSSPWSVCSATPCGA